MTTPRLLRWGIIGTGEIAGQFAKDLVEHGADMNVLQSVFSRTPDKAKSFGSRYGISEHNCFSEFDSFAASNIDICYIATPHTSHVNDALRCLDKNMGILIEKPLALKAKDAAAVFQKAQEKKLFVMEALWTRFIPAMRAAIEAIHSSTIGDVVSIDINHGFDGKAAPDRLKDPALGGGSLFDIGSYSLHLGTLFSKKNPNPAIPKILHTKADVLQNGVDERFNAVLSYPSEAKGEELILNTRMAINEDTTCTAIIHGKKGYVIVHSPFISPEEITINGKTEVIKKVGHGLHYQTREVYDCVINGKTESKVVPWSESLNWAATLESLAEKKKD